MANRCDTNRYPLESESLCVSEFLALGGDLGGTSTRIVVVGPDGREHGRGITGGGNPTTDPAGAAAAFGDALRAALSGVDGARVKASVVGVAGGSALRTPAVATHFDRVWTEAGLTCDPGYVPDLEVAFAGGTPASDGAVLVAGTGAAAGSLTDHRLTRTADGHGWLLGDDGSGFWLGREAVRATLRTSTRGQPPGPLVESCRSASWTLTGRRRDGQHDRVIQVVNSRPGVQLSALAPLVTAAYRAGDPQAQSIVERAAAALLATLGADPGPGREHADRPRGKPGRRRVPGGGRAANAARGPVRRRCPAGPQRGGRGRLAGPRSARPGTGHP